MKRLTARIILAASMLVAAPALAQNTTAPPASPPPSTGTPVPPPTIGATPLPPGPVTPAPDTPPAPSNTVTAAPPPPPAPAPEPMTINPDAAYPNGFADPVDPFANIAQQPQQGGFPWGLFGLLGLLGLIPLFRRQSGRTTRTVYVDRDDPKRVLREERVDD